MSEYKIEWKHVPSWMRFGLSIARVQKILVTTGEFSPNEIENIAKFGYLCIVVTLVAMIEMYCFVRYTCGGAIALSVLIGAIWGVIILNVDRGLFRDRLDKAKMRIALIVFATLVFSSGISVFIADSDLTHLITEENRQSNLNIDKSLLSNIQVYQDRYNEALQAQTEMEQRIAQNSTMGDAIKQVGTIQHNALQYASDTTIAGKRVQKQTKNALATIGQGLKQQQSSETALRETAKSAVLHAQIELDSQRIRYQTAYNAQRQPPNYSQGHKSIVLLNNYTSVGWLHVIVLIFIAGFESMPLYFRRNYRDYDAVQFMIGLGSTPMNQQTDRIKTLRSDIEEAKRMRNDGNFSNNTTDTNQPPNNQNPFADIF